MQQLNSATELLDVQLPDTLIESPSVSTFLPEEDASICPLLLSSNNTNGSTTPLAFSHPLTPCGGVVGGRDPNGDDVLNGGLGGIGLDADENKLETGSSSGSSTGHGLEMVADSAATSLFNKHAAYQHLHLQTNNNLPVQEGHHHHHHHMMMTNGHNGHTLGGKEAPPAFVSWNWPMIRKCTFFIFMSSLFAMCALVVAMIVTLPKSCNPKTAWYRGRVFYEIFPASFQDSNNDGVGDLRGISNRIDYLVALGVSAVRLNSIYPSKHYPEDYEVVTSLVEVAGVLGDRNDVRQLAESLHARNISLILDLSVQGFWKELEFKPINSDSLPPATTTISIALNESTAEETPPPPPMAAAVLMRPPLSDNSISSAIRQWIKLGVDGFYIKGLEHVPHEANIQLAYHLADWQQMLGPYGVLIIGEAAYNSLSVSERQAARPHIDLIDVPLEMLDGTKTIEELLKSVLNGELAPTDEGVWLHWSIGGVDRERLTTRHSPQFTLAATLLQLMLPGTPSIFYGDEIALSGGNGTVEESQLPPPIEETTQHNDTIRLQQLTTMQWPPEHDAMNGMRRAISWLPQQTSFSYENHDIVAAMVALRERSPAIYKNSICKAEIIQGNTEVRRSHDDILIVERFYPRRNSFVSVTNFGNKSVRMDMSSMFYSGYAMLQQPDGERGDKIYFSHFEIAPMETVVVKLDK